MKLSVLMVTYNHERFIEQAVRSALMQQTDFEYEIVIGEDGSTDGTRAVLLRLAEEFPGRLRLLLRERNVGAAENFRDAFEKCRGEYIALLEGDDYWTEPTKLQQQVAFLDANPSYAICCHPVVEVDADGRTTAVPTPAEHVDFGFIELAERNFIPTCSTVFRRWPGPFPDWLCGLLPGDWPLHMLAARYGKGRMFPAIMGAYRIHRDGLWSQRSNVERLRQAVRMLSAARGHLGPERATAIGRSIYHHRLELARLYVEASEPDAALAVLHDARGQHAVTLPWAILRLKCATPTVKWLLDRAGSLGRAMRILPRNPT